MYLVCDRAALHRLLLRCAGAAVGFLALFDAGVAQTTPAASAPATTDISPAERAQRDADKVFRWILIHSDKPRKPAPAAKEETKPTPVARSKPAARAPLAKPESAPASEPAPAATAPVLAKPAAPPSAGVETARIEPAPGAVTLPAPALTGVPSGAPAAPAPAVATAAEASAEQTLVPLLQVDPKLPNNLPRGSRNGEVQIRFVVLPDGSVAEPKIASSSNPRLNSAAIAAVAQWRFAPLRRAQPGSVALVFNVE